MELPAPSQGCAKISLSTHKDGKTQPASQSAQGHGKEAERNKKHKPAPNQVWSLNLNYTSLAKSI